MGLFNGTDAVVAPQAVRPLGISDLLATELRLLDVGGAEERGWVMYLFSIISCAR